MKIVNYLILIFACFCLASCSKVAEPIKKFGVGTTTLNYKGEDQIDSLIIPPDLTQPNFQTSFIKNLEKSDDEIIKRTTKVEVKRDSFRRWLLVNLSPAEVFTLSKDFFRSFGFVIEKENQLIGILETDFLEKQTVVPERSLGPIRAALAKALKTSYGMPTADKYRIRIEPLDNPNKSEVYLTLSTIGEVVSGEMRLWQPKEKDLELETEMLLMLMIYLGSDQTEAVAQIQENIVEKESLIEVDNAENGFAKLVFPYNKSESWRYLGWALDELAIEVEDRDYLNGSYYIKVSPDKGFFSKLINTVSSVKTYQLFVNQINSSRSEVYFVDLSEENNQSSIDYSFELFDQIMNKF